MEKIGAMVTAEFVSAERDHRAPHGRPVDLVALLSLGDWDGAATLCRENPELIEARNGTLHMMAHRNDAARGLAEVMRLLLDAGADPNIRDSRHDADAIGWAEYFKQPEIVHLLKDHAASR
jgi:hypothetical protein